MEKEIVYSSWIYFSKAIDGVPRPPFHYETEEKINPKGFITLRRRVELIFIVATFDP